MSASKLMISAESRFSAISKLFRVRVRFSKNRLTTSRLRRAGTILMLGPLADLLEGLGLVEEGGDVLGAEGLDAEEVAVGEDVAFGGHVSRPPR